MAHTRESELFGISASPHDEPADPVHSGIAQGIGAALAFVVVIVGWAIGKLFGRDLLA